ncbi:MAG: nucleotidyltransferase [Firmicutes bacterium]|nr:nucleotidyltransferase [Bacillota bacterium]
MASTVNTAFSEFLKNTVNLDPNQTNNARSSRNWLVTQIHGFSGNDGFPYLYNEKDIFYGSFARKTKIRELDDIDIMIALSAQGGVYYETSGKIEIVVDDRAPNLLTVCHDYTKTINSRKVINKFINKLNSVSQYEKAGISRNAEAATLKLKTYTWNFDIVPCFFTQPEWDGRTYYLIPDGVGNWKKTDPRIDNARTTEINQLHSGKVLNAIRIMKYWNKRPTMPTMPSYLLECLFLTYFNNLTSCPDYIDFVFKDMLEYLTRAVFCSVQDPKNIQGDLNILTFEQMRRISDKAKSDYNKAVQAISIELSGDHKGSIGKWREIFGEAFPQYT